MSDYEQILLQRFTRNGDAEAFSELVRHNAGLVYGTCVRILTNRDQAADVTQDTFFQLLQNAESITGSVSSWLHGVAVKKAVDLIRRDSSRRRREVKYAMSKQVQAEKWDDISAYVDEALGQLDEQTRQILIQRFFKGVKMTEIGKQFGLSQSSISRHVDAGVLALRKKLQKRGIIVATITLATLLGESAVEAAPAAVLNELGKIAIVGGAKAAAGAAVMSLKAKIVTAVAVAAVGTGTVVTYNVTRTPEPPTRVSQQAENAATVTDSPGGMGMGGGMMGGGTGGGMMGGGMGGGMMGGFTEEPVEKPEAVKTQNDEDQFVGAGGGMIAARSQNVPVTYSPDDPNETETSDPNSDPEATPRMGGMMGGGMGGGMMGGVEPDRTPVERE